MASVGGIVAGFDTCILFPAVIFLKNDERMKPWSDGWKDAIFSANLGMAAFGALFAGIIADTHGRKKAIMLGDIINTLGAFICCAAFNKWILLIGVIFLGVATGMSSHTVPLYIAESCPSYVRGRFITNYQVAVTLGIMLAYAVAGAFSFIDPVYVGWRLMFTFASVPSILQFIGFWYLPQSPRFTFEKEGIEACEKVFEKIYEHNEDWIRYEISQLRAANERAAKNKALYN
uniref:Major facilitator superfamily (MFS) profile domain-containing protein n=1 Tax=Acrobeloides nanus TaxID=290746 RepID=A0A914BZG6_9BILA